MLKRASNSKRERPRSRTAFSGWKWNLRSGALGATVMVKLRVEGAVHRGHAAFAEVGNDLIGSAACA
jgi:hypothetical protein